MKRRETAVLESGSKFSHIVHEDCDRSWDRDKGPWRVADFKAPVNGAAATNQRSYIGHRPAAKKSVGVEDPTEPRKGNPVTISR
jgi:hypothetical protein